MPSQHVIDDFLAQQRVAVVGVSRDPRQFSAAVYRAMRDGARTLHPVNDLVFDGERIEGDLAARTLGEVPGPLDAVLVMVPFARADEVVEAALERGITRIWLHRGFGRGAASPAAIRRAEGAGASVVDGACPLMFLGKPQGIHRLHRRMVGRRVTA